MNPEPSTSHRYAYLHGFASGPRSRKGLALASVLGVYGKELERPDLNLPSFGELTLTGALSAVDGLDARYHAEPASTWCFVGSSMGGWIASRWAQANPTRVHRLVLLCPGFGLTERWPHILGADAFARWERDGTHVFEDGAGVPVPVHWQFIEDARAHTGWPDVLCPTLIVHGRRDVVVPIDSSRRYAAQRDHVELVEVDDDHALTASIGLISDLALSFFELP